METNDAEIILARILNQIQNKSDNRLRPKIGRKYLLTIVASLRRKTEGPRVQHMLSLTTRLTGTSIKQNCMTYVVVDVLFPRYD